MKKLVSILIPAYNAEKWIEETIYSALNQTWKNKEIIIVDDGSKDQTYSIAKKYESKNLKVVTQENKGVCAARNFALSLAQGDYIQWLDADDILDHDKVSKQLDYNYGYNDQDVLMSSEFGTFYYSIKRAKFRPHHLWKDLSPVEYFTYKFKEGVWMSSAVFLVSRNLSESAGPWNEEIIRDNDGEYFCRVVSKSKMIKFVPGAKCYYRRGVIGVSKNLSNKAMQSIFLSRCLCIQTLLSLEDSEKTRSACINLLNSFLEIIYERIYERRDDYEIKNIIYGLHAMAEKLGGELKPPEYKWKSRMVNAVFGRYLADRMKYIKRKVWSNTKKNYDKLYHMLE